MSDVLNPAAAGATAEAAADAVAAAVAACPAVVSLHPGGVLHRTATYLPGRRIDGVRLGDDRVQVSVVGVQGIPVALLSEQIRTAVEPLVAGRPVDVHVADLQALEDQPAALPAGPSA
jgi:hypothetical protein